MAQEVAIEAAVVRETEKALLVSCLCVKHGAHDVWFPKSKIRRGARFIFMPEWLATARAREAGRALGLTKLETALQIEAEATLH